MPGMGVAIAVEERLSDGDEHFSANTVEHQQHINTKKQTNNITAWIRSALYLA